MEIKTIKIEITKEIRYDNGFICEYMLKDDILEYYIFTKNKLPYHYLPYVEEIQKTILDHISMHSVIGKEMFPKFKTESELINIKNFDNFYHLYLSNNNPIIDKDGKIISTCLQFNNRFLNSFVSDVGELINKIENNTIYSKVIYDDEKIYSVEFLLNDDDFANLIKLHPKRIHEIDAMFYLKDMFYAK